MFRLKRKVRRLGFASTLIFSLILLSSLAMALSGGFARSRALAHKKSVQPHEEERELIQHPADPFSKEGAALRERFVRRLNGE